MAEAWDRTRFTPKHDGRNILPCTPLFTRLLRLAHRKSPKIAIRDVRANIERTYLELLTDVLSFRERILDILVPQIVGAIRNGEEIYIAVLAPGGYEYTIAVLTVLAIGAAVVPMTTVLPVEEASYFINKAQAVAVLAAEGALNLGMGLERHINLSTNEDFKCIPIKLSVGTTLLSSADIYISSDRYMDDNAPGVVIFTSGTTGPPKGAVMRRAFTHDFALQVAEHYGIGQEDTLLHCLPVHHATGIGIMFFPPLMAGATIEFRSGGFDEVWMWERWREGILNPKKRLTFFSGVPTIFMRMRRRYQQVLSKLPVERVNEYIAGARQFRAVLCGTSALAHPIAEFWTELMNDRIIQRYGGTEFGAIFKVQMGATDVPDGSVGQRVPGYDVKLSNGDEGEVLVRNPHMFAKYLRDPEATAKAHDSEGYFKTGDIARREGNHHFIIGRASQDIIKSGGYKISALDIERELLALPYIAEAIVVGVSDEEFGQRVGAILTLQPEAFGGPGSSEALTIEMLREDLRTRLVGYKMPTLLRIVEGELPKTASGKILKKKLGEKYFPEGWGMIKEVQVWRKMGKSGERTKL